MQLLSVVKYNHISLIKNIGDRLVLVSGTILILVSSACGTPETQIPFLTPTPTFTASPTPTITETSTPTNTPTITPTVHTSTPTPTEISIASPTFTITVYNPTEWESHLFIDNVYAVTIHPNESGIYQDAPPGVHTIHFCQVKAILSCDPPQTVSISGNTEWVVGDTSHKNSISDVALSTRQLVIPTPPFQSKKVHIIKVNNHTPWNVYIFLDNEIIIKPTATPSLLDTPQVEKPKDEFVPFLSISENQYRTYNGLTTGTYTFIHCYDRSMKRCFLDKTIVLDRDTEWFIFP